VNLITSMRYLVALNQHRHFGRAAQACCITQPALSNALRALEDEFGTSIVKRGRTFLGFTPEGEQVLASAQRILHEQALLEQELRSSASHPKGRLVVGVVPTAMPVAARFAAMLQERHGGIQVVLRSLSSSEIELGLESLALDLALGYTDRLDAGSRRLEVLPQYTEHYYMLRKSDQATQGRLRIGAPISWQQAVQMPLCMLTPEMHYRSIVDRALGQVGVVLRPAIETNCILSLALSVLDGAVCSILPGALLAAVGGYGELEAALLTAPEVRTPIGFILPAGARNTRTAQAAWAFLQEPTWLRQACLHSETEDGLQLLAC
jgi:DNA-binding transcriptional LysR family regulator